MEVRRPLALVLCALTLGCGSSKPQWGFINRQGVVAINPSFAGAKEFSEGLAPVRIDDHWGYIDVSGKVAIPPVFGRAEPFSDGLALVTTAEERQLGDRSTRFGFIDRTGKMVISERFGWALSFSGGLAAACEGECSPLTRADFRVGFIGKDGQFALPPQFAGAAQFSDGLAAVSLGKEPHVWGYIDPTGAFVIEPRFFENSRFSDGLSLQGGFVDREGRLVISLRKGASAEPFSEGLAGIRYARMSTEPESKQNRVEFINTKGETVLKTRPCAGSFSEGLVAVCNEQFLYGYMDRIGHYVIQPRWPKVGRFRSGLAAVCVNCQD